MAPKKQPRSYRQMNEELDAIINEFEEAELDIDRALLLHDSAVKLINEIEAYLKNAKNRIEKAGKRRKQ